jgi:hypothetical protein
MKTARTPSLPRALPTRRAFGPRSRSSQPNVSVINLGRSRLSKLCWIFGIKL